MKRRRVRKSNATTFLSVNVTNKKEDAHFVTPHSEGDENFSFTLPSSISEETWLESLKDITSNIGSDKSADKNNNENDYLEMISSEIQRKFPQLDERIPLFVSRMITSGPPSRGKKTGHVEDNTGLRSDTESGKGAFGPVTSNINRKGRENDDIVEDIIYRELISDLGNVEYDDIDRESQSGKKTFDGDNDLDWINDLDDDESVDKIQTEEQMNQPNDESRQNKKKSGKKFFNWGMSRKFGGIDGVETSSHRVLMAGSACGIDWKVKRYESTGRQMDLLLKPDHEPSMDEILMVLEKVVNAVFEKQYTEDIDKHRIKICLVPQGLDPVAVWSGSPASFVLVEFMRAVSHKLGLQKEISLHFGITLRFSQGQEGDNTMMEKVMEFVEVKKSIIRVFNDDFLGLARSIILAMNHPSHENHPKWSTLRKAEGRSNLLLQRLSLELQKRSGVPIKRHYNNPDFAAFQRVLPAKYRLVILGHPWSPNIVYAGPHAQSNVYIFNYEDLYFAVIKAAGFYRSSYFCDKCLRRYENLGHVCKDKDL